MTQRRAHRKPALPLAAVLAAAWACAGSGCQSTGPDEGLVRLVQEGRFGQARAAAGVWAEQNPKSRRWLLDRERELLLALADGAPSAAIFQADYVYDMLREQGVNRGKGVGTVLWGESAVRIWKGEPFEQALAYHYIGVLDGLLRDWGNVRATARNSLFLLRDFSNVEGVSGGDQAEAKAAVAQSLPDDADAVFEPTVESDFELGYVMQAISSYALGEPEEAEEALAKLVRLAPRLRPLAERIRRRDYDLVLVVDYGLGPEKYAGGPNSVLALYRPRTPSGDEPLSVSINGRTDRFPVVTDVNRLAQDVKWNNLEDMRRAKSGIGQALAFGGGVLALSSNDRDTQLAGLGAALVGLGLQATSRADTTQLEVLPQRVYVALVDLPDEPAEVVVQVDNRPGSRLVLPHVPPPDPRGLEIGPALQYVRLVDGLGGYATSGRLLWANDVVNPLGDPSLPYILGGRDVRTPSAKTMEDWYAAGLPRTVTLGDLLEVFRDEGIWLEDLSTAGYFGRHVLEGGNSLYTPEPMSPSFVRLFAQDHPPYRPNGELLRALRERIAGDGGQGGEGGTTAARPTQDDAATPVHTGGAAAQEESRT